MISDFIKQYSLSAFLILLACLFGIVNPGWLVKYEIGAVALFIFIAIVFLMFYVPTLWKIITDFFKGLWKVITGAD